MIRLNRHYFKTCHFPSDHTRLSVWVLDGDPGHTNLLKFALNEETFPHTLVIFTVAMTTPWGILDQLQSWASVLGDHIDKLDLTPGKSYMPLILCVLAIRQQLCTRFSSGKSRMPGYKITSSYKKTTFLIMVKSTNFCINNISILTNFCNNNISIDSIN